MRDRENVLMRAQGVILAYGGQKIAEVADMEVAGGDFLCIIGENGAGKTTFMKALLGLLSPASGKITLCNGTERHDIGYLPQQTEIQKDFPASVKEVVSSGCLGRKRLLPFFNAEDRKLVAETMEMTGVTELAKRSYRTLSGGQQQRVLLARALCSAKKILFMDEPVTGLDPEAAKAMYRIAGELSRKGMAVVMVTHDMSPVKDLATHILRVGKDPFFGTKEDYEKLKGGNSDGKAD